MIRVNLSGIIRIIDRCRFRRRELIVFCFLVLSAGYIFSSCSSGEKPVAEPELASVNAEPTEISAAPPVDPNLDFSRFNHASAEHARFPCALCHERTDNSATPKLPGHIPCASCHAAQFAENDNAICTICHVDPESGKMKSFPALKSFNVVFDHVKHLRQSNCSTCHKPLRNGEALSIPSGFSAHNSCFQCHSPGSRSGDVEIDSCSTCHKPGKFSGSVSTQADAYTKTPFSHATHRFDCNECHKTLARAPRGRQMTAPVAKMHFPPKNAQSCATCHNNKRAFGGEDFSDCRRCHTGTSFKIS